MPVKLRIHIVVVVTDPGSLGWEDKREVEEEKKEKE